MPTSFLEWLTSIAIIAGAALWGIRVIVLLSRIYFVGKNGLAEIIRLSSDHENLKQDHQSLADRVERGETATTKNTAAVTKIKQELGIA